MADPQLNYHHLRLFWEVARAGSLRSAAARLHLSQPTISAQIKMLESTLGEQLFDRTGRGLKLTEQGRLVMECSAEIFSLGTEMVRSLHGLGSSRHLRLNIGITDSLPKLVAWRYIRPAMKALPHLQLSCAEGHSQDLVGLLASGRLDVVLSDEPASSSLPVKAFNHLLGSSPVIFCATPALVRQYGKGFPASLKDAPMLLPASRTAWRHEIDRWFETNRLHPRVVAEFDDVALMKMAASDGLGIVPIAAVVLDDATQRYGLKPIGRPVRCGFSCYLITLERAMRHPALRVIATESKNIVKDPKGGRFA
ncbi:LysR family transcriptional regulator [Brevifollis gellanilyticus]|uniref:LysR family transcriptional regulator n=1 Tax=Brevifollis gellanilyticus TaxID=748831 RepID=A0A512MHX2_9BACT|nr:LysR family transcriptional regulator [Brevifollis gellanilyticus]GEP46328.1 LysR family transcriptional regulator [Brevifollis gellanilyticus]